MLLIVDADALVVLADSKHRNHARGKVIFNNIIKYKAYCIYPITAICEAATVLQKSLIKPKSAHFLMELLRADLLPTENISKELLSEAMTRFNPYGEQGDTLFDAIIATIAIQHNADAIFSFDKGYKRMGLRLAEDLFLEVQAELDQR